MCRAVLESIAYEVQDLVTAMIRESGTDMTELRVDGGACVSDVMMQFQADLLSLPVLRPTMVETTAAGAAFLAGLATGVWSSTGRALPASADRTDLPSGHATGNQGLLYAMLARRRGIVQAVGPPDIAAEKGVNA